MQRDDFEVKVFPGIDAVGVSDSTNRLRVAIVTEEIIGPVRNGGIASTYYHLAKGLAAHGHEVHVLFLKGPVVQDETPEHWVAKYAEFGVTLHYLEMSEAPLWGPAPVWQRRYASAYEWLRDQTPFDVVHTSEWRGGLVYALMAKRLGLAFRDTLFVVKTSSPYIWNRHYQMQPITHVDLVAASYAEQKCVELADVVIGGSAHLISFMDRIGYRLPDSNVFVQPNVVDFSNVAVVDRRSGPRRTHGDVVKSRDFVFFGRLESRKGLELFCSAVDLLHERGEIPDSVTFLGKWGGNLPAQGGLSPEDFVNEKAQTWDCPVAAITDKNQPEALSFLCERDRIAVMPSLIENSSMAVYEVLQQRVPFIASAVGGTPELIAEADLEACLVEPTAQALADRMQHALRHGQPIARPRFSNQDNLRTWYGFHARVAELIEQYGRSQAITRLTHGVDQPGTPVRTVGYVALVRRGESLDDLVKAFHGEAPDHVVLGFNDTSARAEIDKARCALDELCTKVTVGNCLGQTAGEALNTLVGEQVADVIVVANGVAVVPQLGFFEAARQALEHQPDCLFTTFFAADDVTVGMPLGGDVASHALTSRAYGPEMFGMRRLTFASIGGFEPYEARQGIVHEYITRAADAGHDLLVFPEQLLSWKSAAEAAQDFQSDPLYSYLKAKPLIDQSGLAQRKVLLAALQQARGGTAGVDERLLRGPAGDEMTSQWLMPATWDPENARAMQHRRLIVGLNADRDEIWLYARGRGERRLTVRGEAETAELIVSHGVEDSDEFVTLSTFRAPDSWEGGTSYPLLWGLYDGEEKLRNLFLRINKIGTTTFALSARNPVLSARALTEVVDRRSLSWPEAPDHDEASGSGAETTEQFVSQAVAAARQFVKGRADADPSRIVARSRELLRQPPSGDPSPISPRSGLKPPDDKNGWSAGDWLRGWAWDREDRKRLLHVVVVRGLEPLLMVSADVVDGELDDVPGRDLHAFRIPVLAEYFDAERLHLEIWEGRTRVYRGGLYVDRQGEPMLRRIRDTPDTRALEARSTERKRPWWRRW